MLHVKLEKIIDINDVYSGDTWMLYQISLDPGRIANVTVVNYRIFINLDGKRDPIVVQHKCTLDPIEVSNHTMNNINQILSN